MLNIGSTVQWLCEFWWITEKHANAGLHNMQNISKKTRGFYLVLVWISYFTFFKIQCEFFIAVDSELDGVLIVSSQQGLTGPR